MERIVWGEGCERFEESDFFYFLFFHNTKLR